MDSLWWAQWWPWMLLWAVTAAALIAAVVLLIRQWRDREPAGQPSRGITFYLHDDSVMDIYLSGAYKTALRQEVEEEISSSKAANLNAELHGVGGTAGKTVDRRVFKKYIETAEPIAVIRIVMDVLEKADDVLYIDLFDNVVDPGRALRKALRSIPRSDASHVTFSQLRDLEAYVSVRGRFRQVAESEDMLSFEAPCPPQAEGGPVRALFTCTRSGIRRPVPASTFPARCLGKIQDWNPDDRTLVIDPIAIFQ